MRFIITGGSGLIGQALTGALTKEGAEVIILSRNPEKARMTLPDAKSVYWDGRTVGDWASYIDGSDAVINLAGASIAGENLLKMRWTKRRKREILESRVNAGKAISEAISNAANKPDVLVQSSAIGIYGPLSDEIVEEDFQLADDFLANVCKEWEGSTQSVEEVGVRRVVIRTGLVFSKSGGIFSLQKLPFSMFVGGPIGSGVQFISWIHIEDLVRAILFLVNNKDAVGVHNLTAPNPISNKDFARVLGKAMGRPSYFPLPSFAMNLALGEVSTLILDGQKVIPSRLLQAGFQYKFDRLENALIDLLEPTLHFRYAFMVNATKEAVVAFHRDTRVLKRLTPFPIIVQFKQVEAVSNGSKAIFILWFGPIPVPWEAKHHNFDPETGFSDTQVKGPFDYWFHKHRFVTLDDQTTAVIDDIHARIGKSGFSALISRFMWLTLPILFAYRSWQTRRTIENT